MASKQDIDRKIRSVSNTRKITRAMEMVSAARLRKAQQRIETLRPFADALVELTVRVSRGLQGDPHPLLVEREIKNVAIVMFTGDRGLAGALNANVLRRSLALSAEWEAQGVNVRWIGVGKKGVGSLQFRKKELDSAYRGITDAPKFRDAEAIAQSIIGKFDAGDYDKVVLVYNQFKSAVTQEVLVRDLLPLTDDLMMQALARGAAAAAAADADGDPRATDKPVLAPTDDVSLPSPSLPDGDHGPDGHRTDWIFEPDSDALLGRLLPTYVEQTVYRALLESTASEHGARMSAMRNASENAAELVDEYTLLRNRARQAAITQEILEVVGGAEAL